MEILKELRDKLKGRQLYTVAKETGLSYPTIKALVDNSKDNFTLHTLETLHDYVNKNPK